ncbi:hypothetical protein A7P95_10865 [Eikenella longinqua]|uniref:Uncharacterized protein n=1 Tax=Eikenella longinqua TaxID=1795827 RepID=A0A1A9RUM1_9NEIS|nr:hypothetical protein [Eikenella longinqua]OAM25896.1 hypothetical protein A7P95_10865 [Eikenella longinqua]
MVKFVITEEAMSPIAQALSGQSRMAGVAAGLKNQMLGVELDKMRDEREQAARQRQIRDNLIPNYIRQQFGDLSPRVQNRLAERLGWQNPNPEASPNLLEEYNDAMALQKAMSQPQWGNAQRYADAINLNNAYGGSGLEAIRGIGIAQENANKQQLGELALTAYQNGDVNRANQLTAMRSGDTYTPFRVGSNGEILNTATGGQQSTDMYRARVDEVQSRTGLNYANTALSGARTQTEGLRQQGLAIDNNGKLVRLNEQLNPQQKPPSQVYKPLPAAAVESVFNMDANAYQRFRQEMAREGYADENEYLPIYLRQLEGAKDVGGATGRAMGLRQLTQALPTAPTQTAPNVAATVPQQPQIVMPIHPLAGALSQYAYTPQPANLLPAANLTGRTTQYDTAAGLFGEQGSISYADNMAMYDNIVKNMGLPPLGKSSPQQVRATLTQLYQSGHLPNGSSVPRDHIEALAARYLK